jgi:hypothetical protein
MKTLRIDITNEKAMRPSGNPFDVKPVEILGWGAIQGTHWIADTGIKICLEDNMTLNVISLVDDMFIVGWNMLDTLKIAVKPMSNESTKILMDKEQPIARVAIIEQKLMTVRFVEFAKGGGRLITGEPQAVKPEEKPLCETSHYCNNGMNCEKCLSKIGEVKNG